MRRALSFLSILVCGGLAAPTFAATPAAPGPTLGLGTPATPQELSHFFAIPPDGAGLPAGSGSVAQGKQVYAEKCMACHGDKLQGVKPTGGLPLIGGRGTLTSAKPLKTTESYWPYATTMFDYIKRAMPFNAPGSLKDDEVYAVVAYILAEGHVVGEDATLDKASLPKVQMPNRNGFRPYPGPDQRIYR